MSNPQPNTNEKIKLVQKEIDDTKNVMFSNIDKIIQRGDRLEDIQDRTDQLVNNSSKFKKASQRLKRSMCVKNYKMAALITIIVMIILVFFILIIVANAKK